MINLLLHNKIDIAFLLRIKSRTNADYFICKTNKIDIAFLLRIKSRTNAHYFICKTNKID